MYINTATAFSLYVCPLTGNHEQKNCGAGPKNPNDIKQASVPAFEKDHETTRTGSNNANVLGGGFKHFSCSPLFGEESHFD